LSIIFSSGYKLQSIESQQQLTGPQRFHPQFIKPSWQNHVHSRTRAVMWGVTWATELSVCV
jgi:hypothetical protein